MDDVKRTLLVIAVVLVSVAPLTSGCKAVGKGVGEVVEQVTGRAARVGARGASNQQRQAGPTPAPYNR